MCYDIIRNKHKKHKIKKKDIRARSSKSTRHKHVEHMNILLNFSPLILR